MREEEQKKSASLGPSMARKEKGTGILPSTSDGNFIGLILFSRITSAGKKLHGGYTGDYLYDFVAKISILATFFLRFFHLSRRQFEGGYTCDFHLALATPQNLKKSHHLRERKNRSCSRGLKVPWLVLWFIYY